MLYATCNNEKFQLSKQKQDKLFTIKTVGGIYDKSSHRGNVEYETTYEFEIENAIRASNSHTPFTEDSLTWRQNKQSQTRS